MCWITGKPFASQGRHSVSGGHFSPLRVTVPACLFPGGRTMPAVDTKSIARELKKDGTQSVSVGMRAAKRFGADKCTTLAAGIAFYSAFSLAPMLLMVIAVAGWFYGAEAARGQLFSRVQGFLGSDAAAAIQAIVEHAHQQGGGGFAAILSIVLLVVGASATFSSLNTALDVVLPMPKRESRSGVVQMVRTRLISFGLVLGVAFLLIVSLVLDTVITFIGAMLWQNTPFVFFGNLAQMLVSFVIMLAAFGALIKFLPDASALVRWRDAAWGGAVSALLFTIGKKLFAMYLAHAGTASAFGAAGSLAVLLMWLYFSAAVLLLGAEVAAVRGGFDLRDDSATAPDTASHPAGASASAGTAPHAAGQRLNPGQTAHDVMARARTAIGSATAHRGAGPNRSAARQVPGQAIQHPENSLAPASTVPLAPPSTARSLQAAVDRAIARSRYPTLLKLATQAAPLVLQGISLLLPTHRRAVMPPSAPARGAKGATAEPSKGRGKSAVVAAMLAALFQGKKRPAPPKRGVTHVTGVKTSYGRAVASRTRHPVATALFAAGTGLVIASLANRTKK